MRRTTIGGSALIEGILMIGAENAAIAVRKPDGSIIMEKRELPVKSKLSKLPVIRGTVSFFRQMVLSTKALMFSAEFFEIDENDKKSAFDKFLKRLFGDKTKDAVVYFSLILSLAFSIGMFILLPNIIAGLFHFDKNTYTGLMYYNLFEGIIKLGIFFEYLYFVSRVKDVRRVFEYHGAEHKTINCYEHEDELTVSNVMKYSTRNARCGTSYMFLVILVSILCFSLLGWYEIWLNVLIRLLLMPLIAGITFEIFRYASNSNSRLAEIIAIPGMLFQIFTTKEPDEHQVEVAILAFNNALAKQ